MTFCAYLADRLHHSSIKVYLSAVRSLHIDCGYPGTLTDIIQLQRLLQRIKQHNSSNLPQRQPVTADLLALLRKSLDFSNPDKCQAVGGFLPWLAPLWIS